MFSSLRRQRGIRHRSRPRRPRAGATFAVCMSRPVPTEQAWPRRARWALGTASRRPARKPGRRGCPSSLVAQPERTDAVGGRRGRGKELLAEIFLKPKCSNGLRLRRDELRAVVAGGPGSESRAWQVWSGASRGAGAVSSQPGGGRAGGEGPAGPTPGASPAPAPASAAASTDRAVGERPLPETTIPTAPPPPAACGQSSSPQASLWALAHPAPRLTAALLLRVPSQPVLLFQYTLPHPPPKPEGTLISPCRPVIPALARGAGLEGGILKVTCQWSSCGSVEEGSFVVFEAAWFGSLTCTVGFKFQWYHRFGWDLIPCLGTSTCRG
ncbi:uncharacterized protein LOC125114426 [Phacochoerus africanus]|uniref:uncharacterized protein LOC125114426 n=1 Tax=Phacochoerus africanus TaxID=41426 RepID=UPI001FD8C419|nr:uncharacterized protein LOC125114426 [Phacochoerus africanus]